MGLVVIIMLTIIILSGQGKLELRKPLSDKVIFIVKVCAIINLLMVILMISDMLMPRVTYEGNIQIVNETVVVVSDNYTDSMGVVIKDIGMFRDGENIEIGETRIFQEVEQVSSLERHLVQNYAFPDFYPYIGMIVMNLMSLFVYIAKSPQTAKTQFYYLLGSVLALVLGLINLVITYKIFAVHVLQIVDRV